MAPTSPSLVPQAPTRTRRGLAQLTTVCCVLLASTVSTMAGSMSLDPVLPATTVASRSTRQHPLMGSQVTKGRCHISCRVIGMDTLTGGAIHDVHCVYNVDQDERTKKCPARPELAGIVINIIISILEPSEKHSMWLIQCKKSSGRSWPDSVKLPPQTKKRTNKQTNVTGLAISRINKSF